MTCIIDVKSNRHLLAKLAAGLTMSVLLVLGTLVASAGAEAHPADHRGAHHGGDHRGVAPASAAEHRGYHHGGDYRGDRGHAGRDGDDYRVPPVVYGPAIGINLPGISIGVR